MNYLIDGYNLLHALWAIGRKVGPRGLRKARLALLGLLQQTFADEAANVTVVFDAAGAPPGLAGEEFHEKIHVRYAVHEEEADDLIEALIRRESAPQNLTILLRVPSEPCLPRRPAAGRRWPKLSSARSGLRSATDRRSSPGWRFPGKLAREHFASRFTAAGHSWKRNWRARPPSCKASKRK